MTYTFRPCWAIECEPGALVFDGWFDAPYATCPAHRDGFHLATWATRKAAREALKRVRGPANRGRYPHARVVRVTLSARGV